MRIGLDAKWYFTGPPSTQTLLHNLLPRLFNFYPEHEWIIFLDKKDRHFGFPFNNKNVTPVYVWADNNLFSNLFILPYHIRQRNINITVFQTFPPFQRKINSIAFIHDVLFRDYPQFFTWKEQLYFKPLSWLAPKATQLIATTEFVANELVKHKYAASRSKIDIIPLGVSSELKPIEQHDSDLVRRIKEKYHLPQDFVLFVGRLNIRKNIGALIKAIPFLHDQNLALVIVGKIDGKQEEINDLIQKQEKHLIVTGAVTNTELAVIYALAKLFCFPSFAEGFGLPPIEAMASGVPVVVSDIVALKEVCGDAAVYIDPAQPRTIAEALNNLLEEPNLYTKQRKKGLDRSAKYNWDVAAQLVMQTIIKTAKK